MRRLLYLLPLLLLTCHKEEPFVIDGEWKIDRLESVEDYYLYGLNFTTDTVFDNLVFYFDSVNVYTILNDTLQPVEIIGFIYSNSYMHTYQYLDTSLFISYEEWDVVSQGPNTLVIENKTVYGIVGEQLRTLYFIRR